MILRVFFFYALLPLLAEAQVSMEDFLLTALDEPVLQSFTRQDNFLNAKPFRLAAIQKLEFRTESNQLDPQRQDYAVRLNPANPWERKRNNQYFKAYQELLQLDRNRSLKQLLQARYVLIIGWIYYQEMSMLKEEDQETTAKMLAILEGQRFSAYFAPDDYVKLKLDEVEKAIELEDIHFEIENQQRKVEALYPIFRQNAINWHAAPLISIEALEILVDKLLNIQLGGGELAYREKKIDLVTREWQLEKSNINIGYLQTQYQNYRIEQGRQPWSISMGLTIPVFNPNKGDMTKRKLNMIEAEGDLTQAQDEQQVGREVSYRKIKSLTVRYRAINNMMQELNLGTISIALHRIKDSNPSAVIRLQEQLIKLKTMAFRLKQEIYLSYIAFLGFSEVIQQAPLQNYLSPNLATLN